MRAAALASILLFAGCVEPSQPEDALSWSGDFHAMAHNNSTLPGRFEFRLEREGTTVVSESRQVMGGESTQWTEGLEGPKTYRFRMTFSGLTGGGGAINGTLEPKDCPDGDLSLDFVGYFLPDGRPIVGGGASLVCNASTTLAH